MKNIDEITKLLDSFYLGETSPDEETILHEFFIQPNVPEEMKDEQEAFLTLYKADEPPMPEGLEMRLSSLIDDLDKTEAQKTKKVDFRKKKKRWMEIGGIAASICLLVSVGMFVLNQKESKTDVNTEAAAIVNSKISVEDQAKIIEAQKALEMVSTKFNKGLDGVEFVSK